MAGGNDTFAQAHEEPEDEGWLLSFADLVTNLMALFLVLYSISDPDPGKFQTAAQSIGAALNAPPQAAPSPFADLVAQLNQEKHNAGEQTNAVGAQSSMRTHAESDARNHINPLARVRNFGLHITCRTDSLKDSSR